VRALLLFLLVTATEADRGKPSQQAKLALFRMLGVDVPALGA
jgi:hypothetical protein